MYDNDLHGQRVRYLSIALFSILYLTFVILFGIRLNEWNDTSPGHCYSTSRVALLNAKHPYVDQIYLGVTSLYCFILLVSATVYCRIPRLRAEQQKVVILVGMGQFILHVYMAIALRISNQSLLDNPSIEEQWGFAQVLAVVMLGATLVQCAESLEGMRPFR